MILVRLFPLFTTEISYRTVEKEGVRHREGSDPSGTPERAKIGLGRCPWDDKAEKYVPPFCEKDPEDFFSQFEKNASIHQWPLHRWAPLLSNVFTGAARQAYTALTAEESRDYSTIKSTVLRAYERVPSHYRKIFRSTLKQPNQTCVEFFREKMAQAKRWVDSEGVGGSYKKLLELFVYEEVKSSMPPQLQSYLEGLGKHDLESAGPASDHYLILNPNVHFSRKVPLSQSALQPNSTVMGSRESASTSHLSGRPRFTPSASGESANRDVRTAGSTSNKLPTNQLGCTYCKKPNHTLATCFLVSRCAYCKQTGHLKDKCPKRGKYNASPALLVNKTNDPLVEPVSPSGDIPALGKVHNFQNICNNVPSDVHEYYKPYCFSGSVSLHGDSQPSIPITLLRDSGALHNFVLRKVVPPLSQCQVGGSLRVKGLFSQGEVPLCRIYLQSPVVSGYITAGIVDELPVDGVSLVLGNVTVENMPGQTAPSTNHGNPPDPMPPKVSPVCVVTRSASRRMASNAPSEPHPSKTTIGNTVGHDTLSPEFSLQDFFQQAGKEPDPPESSLNSDPVVHCIEGTPVTRSTLIAEQARDPQLKALKECFLDESAAVPLAAYVKRFRERMCIAQRVASENLQGAQVKMKAHYDQTHKVQSREFHPGTSDALPRQPQPLPSAMPRRRRERRSSLSVSHPYRLNAEKREVLRQEVQRLLEQGLIEPSLSPWASPVVMVPKSNGKIVMILVRLFPLFTTEISYRTVEKEGVRVGQLPTQQVVSLVVLEEE
ncbi:hypothetical protein O3P69_003435 [Scylla paramamosain]|uniref:CCHC-type domain-containing protein n=1 Tax=Scylla paramamosain TaxID=85552 RepID=A0AAW0UHM0_SCYPA